MSAGGAAAEVIASPSGRFDLPASAVRHVDDTDEEVCAVALAYHAGVFAAYAS